MASAAVHGLLLLFWLVPKPPLIASGAAANVVIELIRNDTHSEQKSIQMAESEAPEQAIDAVSVLKTVKTQAKDGLPEEKTAMPDKQPIHVVKNPQTAESNTSFEQATVQYQPVRVVPTAEVHTAEVQASEIQAANTDNVRIQVRDHLEGFKFYPSSARRRGIEGAVDVSFQLNNSGHAEAMQVVSGSGYSILDAAALETVHRAEPFPVNGGTYRFRLVFSRS